jgi:hypothetical protein
MEAPMVLMILSSRYLFPHHVSEVNYDQDFRPIGERFAEGDGKFMLSYIQHPC